MNTICALVLFTNCQQHAPMRANEVSFDHERVEATWVDNRWQVRAGTIWLKDFGRRELDAREAVRIIRTLRLNRMGHIGSPKPIIEYWLSQGQPPREVPSGMATVAFDPASLREEESQGLWIIKDSRRSLFTFGNQPEQARDALNLLKAYGFDRVGYVGKPIPGMMVFFATSDMKDGKSPKLQPAIFFEKNNLARKSFLGSSSSVEPSQLPAGRQLSVPSMRLRDNGDPSEPIRFEWRNVRVHKAGEEWHLLHGSLVLASFANERDATDALATVQHYRFTEKRVIGQGAPICSYYLCGGQPPKGSRLGLSIVQFRPESISIVSSNGTWILKDGERVILRLGDNEDDAKKVVHAIRFHRFDQLCSIGFSQPSPMSFFVRSR